MKLQLPRTIETDQYVTVILDDGRRVNIGGHGQIYVYRSADALGSEDYSLELPSVEYVGTHCDARDDVMSHGHVTIQVQHRH